MPKYHYKPLPCVILLKYLPQNILAAKSGSKCLFQLNHHLPPKGRRGCWNYKGKDVGTGRNLEVDDL